MPVVLLIGTHFEKWPVVLAAFIIHVIQTILSAIIVIVGIIMIDSFFDLAEPDVEIGPGVYIVTAIFVLGFFGMN